MAATNGIGGGIGNIGGLGDLGGAQGLGQQLQEALKGLPPEIQQKLMDLLKQLMGGQQDDQKKADQGGGGGGGGADKAGDKGGAGGADQAQNDQNGDLIDEFLKNLAKQNPQAAKQIAQALGKQDPTAQQTAQTGGDQGIGGQLGDNLAGQSNFEAAAPEAPMDLGGAEAA